MEIWQIWVIAALLFFIVEIFTSGFAIACLSVGCLFSAVGAALELSMTWQVALFALGAFLAFIFIRPFVLKLMNKNAGTKIKTNMDNVIGRKAVVTEKIESDGTPLNKIVHMPKTISYEQLLTMNPDVIVVPTNSLANGSADFAMEDLLNDPELSEVNAIKNGAVYQMPIGFEAWDSPAPSGVLGVKWMLQTLYPELYTADDFAADVQEFYETFYGFSAYDAAANG